MEREKGEEGGREEAREVAQREEAARRVEDEARQAQVRKVCVCVCLCVRASVLSHANMVACVFGSRSVL